MGYETVFGPMTPEQTYDWIVGSLDYLTDEQEQDLVAFIFKERGFDPQGGWLRDRLED